MSQTELQGEVPPAAVHFTVVGTPAPQGSKRAFVVKGRPVLTESSSKVKPWREAVKYAARDAMEGQPPLRGPLALQVIFRLPKPVSLSTAKAALGPIRKPDLDKLLRSTMDALSDAAVWNDDAQVVCVIASKKFPSEFHPVPGASILIWDHVYLEPRV